MPDSLTETPANATVSHRSTGNNSCDRAYDCGRQLADEYHDRGIVVIRGLFDEWIPALRDGVEENIRSPGPFAKHYTPEGQSGMFFGDYCNWQRIPQYADFVRQSAASSLVAGLIGASEVRFFHEHVLVKEPGTAEPTPWHHDQPYYSVDGNKNCSLWMPLDVVPQSVCPQFIVGSHRWGRWFRPRRFTGQDWDRDDKRDGLEPIPDFDAERDQYDIASWSLNPGDALAFHFLTVHGAPANLSQQNRRRGFSTRWVGEDATWAVRSGPTSPPFPELKDKLKPGDTLDDEVFPIVFSASA